MPLPKNRCPSCETYKLYKLADGRLQCAKCRERIRPPKSVWDSFRLAPEIKDRLVDMVDKGLPTNSPEVRDLSSRPTRDRFARLACACYSHAVRLQSPVDECVSVVDDPSVDARHWPRGRRVPRSAIVIELSERKGGVQVKLVDSRRGTDLWYDIARNCSPGSPWFKDERHAYVWLAAQGERVAIPKSRRPRTRIAIASATERVAASERAEGRPQTSPDLIERFWKYCERRLRLHDSIARSDLHLYLGEAWYRYKTRGRRGSPKERLVELMKQSSLLDIERVRSG